MTYDHDAGPVDDGYAAEDEWREEMRRARENDAQRTGGARRLFDPPTEETGIHVPCRDCGKDVLVAGWIWEQAQSFSEILAKRGEPPIEQGELTRCPPCAEAWHARWLKTQLEWHEKVGQLVQLVKKGDIEPKHELEWLDKHGYGATADALRAIVARRAEEPPAKRTRRAAP